MGDDLPEPIDQLTGDEDFDRRFMASWRTELIDRAWGGVARLEETSGQPYHTVLRMKVENPEMHSPELAEQLSGPLAGRSPPAG